MAVFMVICFASCVNSGENQGINKPDQTEAPTDKIPEEELPKEKKSDKGYFTVTADRATVDEYGEIQGEINIILSDEYRESYGNLDWFGLYPETVSDKSVSASDSMQHWNYVRAEKNGIINLSRKVFCQNENSYIYPGIFHLYLFENDGYSVIDGVTIEFKQEKSQERQPMKDINVYGKILYSFNLIGDFQFGSAGCDCEGHLKAAFEAMKKYNPDGQFIVSVGDQADNGLKTQHDGVYKIYKDSSVNIPMYISTGNHDRSISSYKKVMPEQYRRFSGIETDKIYYSFESGDSVFFVLGTEEQWSGDIKVYISEEQYSWFEKGFSKAKSDGKIIFVINHEPFYDTVAGSLPGQNWHGFESSTKGNCYSKVQKLCDTYSNCFVLTGHTHWVFDSKSNVLSGEGKRANYVNCSAVGYSWFGSGGGYGTKDASGRYTGSEGYFVYVFEDRVVFRGWDFENDCFVRDFTFELYK